MRKKNISLGKHLLFGTLLVLLVIISLELLTSTALIHLCRWQSDSCVRRLEKSPSSIVNFIDAVTAATSITNATNNRYRVEVSPAPFFRPDPDIGYAPRPGAYTVTYFKKEPHTSEWAKFRTQVTINSDGTRWTGTEHNSEKPYIYIFGDSFVFGSGVNDEQTFSFLLQQALPGYNVKLVAAGGYSLTEAFLNFKRLKQKISHRDIIILGYADFYDIRHVVAPSRLRELERWKKERHEAINASLVPKAQLDQYGGLRFSYVQQNCSLNGSYCDQSDPDKAEMSNITAALVNQIGENTRARVYLLHFLGSPNNPVRRLIDPRVKLISALPGDFDYQMRDDVKGFDPHPGPYWHYAIFTKLRKALKG